MKMAIGLEDGLSLDGHWCIKRDTQTSPFLTEKTGIACMERNYYIKIYNGPERTEYCIGLNVLEGKAYEKPCWPQYI